MPYCPICEKCLHSNCRKGSKDRKYQLGNNLKRPKALSAFGIRCRDWRDDTTDGIISTKCGHLYHKSCLQEYITNYRTKGDCYGTTYNVLCPLCGANLSNGKMLRIDLEAHFGILEEFFQDLCKLKYMNKELKRTVQLEWTDIADIEKKLRKAKAEYERVRAIKRNNEQKCSETEERISKALEDARTCDRYREIEKQLIDENVNLEAVARRMETIINTRIPTTCESSSKATVENKNDPENNYNKNRINCPQIESTDCQPQNHTESHQFVTTTKENDLLEKSCSTTSESNEDIEDVNKSNVETRKVDISVQISVHSEWSVNSCLGNFGKVDGEVLNGYNCTRERVEVCSSQQRSSSLLSINSNSYSDSVPNELEDLRSGSQENVICQTKTKIALPCASNLDEYRKEHLSITNRKEEGQKDIPSNKVNQKLEAIETSSVNVDRSKSYTIQKYTFDKHEKIDFRPTGDSSNFSHRQLCYHSIDNDKANQGQQLLPADKSRSYTIQTFVTTERRSNDEILWPLEQINSDDLIDPLLKSLLYPNNNNNCNEKHKYKRRKFIEKTAETTKRDIQLKQFSLTNNCIVKDLKNDVTIKNKCSKHFLQLLLGKCSQQKLIETQTYLIKDQSKVESKSMNRKHKGNCICNEKEKKRFNRKDKPAKSINDIISSTYNFTIPSVQVSNKGLVCRNCNLDSQRNSFVPHLGLESGSANQGSEGELVISPPEQFASEIKNVSKICMDLSFPLLTIPSPRKSVKVYFKSLTMAENPGNNKNEKIHQLDLVIPPISKDQQQNSIFQRDNLPEFCNRCETPESTRKLSESISLLKSDQDECWVKSQDQFVHDSTPNVDDESEDELLKSVISKAKLTLSIENDNASGKGGGDVMIQNDVHQGKQYELEEQDRLIQFMISNQDISTHTRTRTNTQTVTRGSVKSSNSDKFCNCLAAERFVKDRQLTDTVASTSNVKLQNYSSVQSVLVGVEPADDHRNNYPDYEQQSAILNTNQYFYSKAILPEHLDRNQVSLQSDCHLLNELKENDSTTSCSSRATYYSPHNYYPPVQSTKRMTTVTTPIVFEYKNSHNFNQNVIYPRQIDNPNLTRNLNINNNCWLTDTHLLHSNPQHPHFITSHQNFL